LTSPPLADQSIVVTGGAGFLGSAVVEALRSRGCRRVFVPRSREYDLVDGEAVRKLLRACSPDLVIHLAARVGGIGANRENPGTFYYDNLMMGTQLLHEAMRSGVRKLVATATICAYPKFAPVPFHEEELWNGYPEETNAPYGLAKKMLLVQSQAYRAQFGFDSAVLFPVNLYGPGDNFDPRSSHVIPAMIRKIDEAMRAGRDEVVLWGDGSPTREFLYVTDAAAAIVLACERYSSSEPLNVGSGNEISVRDLASLIARIMGFRGRFAWDATMPNGQPRRALDVTRAKSMLGWSATMPLEDGLRRTIEWWRTQR
jgi:GDP-L-fucose synthase